MHPIFLNIGDFTIGTYGVAIVVGMLAGLRLIACLARRRGLGVDFFLDLAFLLLITGFVGGRIFYILLNWGEFMRDPAALILSRQGFVFLGGFMLALAVAVWFTLKRRMPLLETVDILAPGVALAHAIGRIGCFLAGCCYGRVCDADHGPASLAAVAMRYPLVTDAGGAHPMFNMAYMDQLQAGWLKPGAAASLPVVPVQLFEAVGNLLICMLLVWLWRRRRFSGQVFAVYMIVYSVERFGLEFLRGDAERGLWLGATLSTSQIISCLTLLVGVCIWWARRAKGIQRIPEQTATPDADPAPPPAKPGLAPRPQLRRQRGTRK